MSTTIISTTVNHTVTLSSGKYGADISITNSGVVLGSTLGVNSFLAGDSLQNAGNIHAGQIGVYMFNGNMTNSGHVNAGTTGVEIKTGTLVNSGSIYGTTFGIALVYGNAVNSGSISSNVAGAVLRYGSFSNAASGVVNGNEVGLLMELATGTNAGLINNGLVGAGIYGHGALNNSGSINGTMFGVYLFSGAAQAAANGQNPIGAIAGDIWNLPNTAIGLTVDGLDILAGVAEGKLPNFSFSPQGALQISNLPNVIGFEGAITFGDVQLYTGVRPTTLISWPSSYTGLSGFTFQQDEDGHTIQSSILGPLFFPAYGGGAMMYGWNSNPFETHADQHAAFGTSALL